MILSLSFSLPGAFSAALDDEATSTAGASSPSLSSWRRLFFVDADFPKNRFAGGCSWESCRLVATRYPDMWICSSEKPPVPVLLVQVLVYLHLVGHQSGGSGRSLTRSMSPTCSYSFLTKSHLCENIDCRRVRPLLWMEGVHCSHVRSRVQDMFFAFELMPRHVKTHDDGQQRLNRVLDIVHRLSDATRCRNGLEFGRLCGEDLQVIGRLQANVQWEHVFPRRCELFVTFSSTEDKLLGFKSYVQWACARHPGLLLDWSDTDNFSPVLE